MAAVRYGNIRAGRERWPMSSALIRATSLPERSGPRPQTGPSMPHQQLNDNAPAEIQEKLFERARSLSGVRTSPSRVSVPGARVFFMEDTSKARPEAFMIGSEFAHLHPSQDGSLHLVLPAEANQVIDKGGEIHPMARGEGRSAVPLMVYGPRNDEELEVVWLILQASFEYAGGLDKRPEPS
jgi:hypothetical protein